MGIVFDEVVGSIEPERTAEQAPPPSGPAPKEPRPEVIRRQLRWLQQREARLRA